MAASPGYARMTLTRGSDPGTVCVDLETLPSEPGSSTYDTFAVVSPENGPEVFALSGPCTSGIDEAVITDLFANPQDYFFEITTWEVSLPELCGGSPWCSQSHHAFAQEGSACEMRFESVNIAANTAFDLEGWLFTPYGQVELAFAADAVPGATAAMLVEADGLTTLGITLAARVDQVGRWTVTVTDPSGCAHTLAVQVGDAPAGSSFPSGAIPLPDLTGPAGEDGGGSLPDTAMPEG